MAQLVADSIRIIGFDTDYRAGKARDWVTYGPAANIKNCQTRERVDFLKPPVEDTDEYERASQSGKQVHMTAVWNAIEPAYKAWKDGEALPEDGTPLASWGGVDKGQAQEFKKHHIKTVEDVAAITDSQLSKINLPGVSTIRSMAKKFVEGAPDAERDAKIAEMEEQLAAALALLEEQAKPKAKSKTKEAA